MSLQNIASSISTLKEMPPGGAVDLPGDRVGQILIGCYRLERRLAVGTVTELYQGYNLKRQQLCSIKLLREDVGPQSDLQRRFEREAQLFSRLSHPHIAEAHQFAHAASGQAFLIMERLHGCTLAERLADEECFSLAEALRIAAPLSTALQYVHDLGILSPSIHPTTIFLHQASSNHPSEAKLFDFGLSYEKGDAAPLAQGSADNLLNYWPPECQENRNTPLTDRGDQWALALLTYHMLVGRLPTGATFPSLQSTPSRTVKPAPLQALRPDLPAHVCAAINRALSTVPEQRFARIDDFFRALTKPPANPRLRKPERSEAPATLQFESADLVELCRQASPTLEAVPEPISEGDTTNRYSESMQTRLLTQAQVEDRPRTEPSDTTKGISEANAGRAPAGTVALLLIAALGLAVCWQSGNRTKQTTLSSPKQSFSIPPVMCAGLDSAGASAVDTQAVTKSLKPGIAERAPTCGKTKSGLDSSAQLGNNPGPSLPARLPNSSPASSVKPRVPPAVPQSPGIPLSVEAPPSVQTMTVNRCSSTAATVGT